jgi:hypothetical protein
MRRGAAGILEDDMVVPFNGGNRGCRLQQPIPLYATAAPSAAAPMVLKTEKMQMPERSTVGTTGGLVSQMTRIPADAYRRSS